MRRRAAIALALLGIAQAAPAWAEKWRVVPSIGLSANLSDNAGLAPPGQEEADFWLTLTPAISISGEGARVKLNLNYSVSLSAYARDTDLNDAQQYLSAFGTLEAVDDWLFVDANASISQNQVSILGPLVLPGQGGDRNRTQSVAYQISPYIRGRIGTDATYVLRYSYSGSGSGSAATTGIATSQWVGAIRGSTGFRNLGWAIEATATEYLYDVGRNTNDNRVTGILNYRFNPELTVFGSGGYEKTNFFSIDEETRTTYGGGLSWTPTPRTALNGRYERRFFGDSYSYGLTHRTPLTSWSLTGSRDLTSSPQQLVGQGQGTAFDLLFNLLASQIPDPVQRAQEVQRRLAESGTPTNLLLPPVVNTARVYVQESLGASVGILGARNSVTFSIYRSSNNPLIRSDESPIDDASAANTVQTGASVSWGLTLTGLSTLNTTLLYVRSTGEATSSLESDQSALRVLYSTQLGPKTSGSIGARHVRFNSKTATQSDYRENAVFGTVSHSF